MKDMIIEIEGKDISLINPARVCKECGEILCDDELDTAFTQYAWAVYWSNHVTKLLEG